MNKTVKTIMLVVGIVLIIYGIYTLIVPEASVSTGGLPVDAQNNDDAYITIGLGMVALVLGLVGGKKLK